MNTLQVKITNKIKSFNDLYKYAKKQFLAYEKLEGIDNWKEYDFSIDCAEDQEKFKHMLQIRFIEELTEASEAIINNEKDHFWEEITDSINFFLSAYIMLGTNFKKFISPKKILNTYSPAYLFAYKHIPSFDAFGKEAYRIIHQVGLLCNLLKNRKWTQSNYLVSMLDFNIRLENLWVGFWFFIKDLGLTEKDIFELFERKYLVNKWRIQTGY